MLKSAHLLPAVAASACFGLIPLQDAIAGDGELPVTVSGTFGIYSDYRVRGVSYNDRKVTPQGLLTIATRQGFYVTAFGSSIADGYGGTEIDLLGGFSSTYGALTYDIGIGGYIYPKAGQFSYYELYGSLSGTIGIMRPKIGFYWAPKQTAVGLANVEASDRRHNLYVYSGVTAAIPNTPFSLNAQIGLETGAYDFRPTGSKLDWQIGGSASFHGLTLSANYVDSNVERNYFLTTSGKDAAAGAVVVSLSYSF